MASLGRRTLVALGAAVGVVVLLLSFAIGWTTDDGEDSQPRAVLLSATPTAVAVARLSAVPPLPDLRPAPQARPSAKSQPRRPPTKAAARQPRRPAPQPVTIVGSG